MGANDKGEGFMNLVEENEIEYPRTVRVSRPAGEYDEKGNYTETEIEVIGSMIADIQLSLKIRDLISENGSGVSDHAAYLLFCNPAVPILAGDRVYDGERVFAVESVGEWGSHTECVMKKM
jgi:hypothetical protein